VALALVSVLAVAALAAALFLLRTRSALQRQLDEARARAEQLGSQVSALAAERDELHDKHEWLTAASARTADDAERQRARVDELSVLLDAATSASPSPQADADAAGLWHLVLSHVTRRWAAVVGVPPGNRHMVAGPRSAQLAQALAREVERLREEVGVDVELTVAGPVEPEDAVPFLLSAVELLGALASSAERVTVELDGRMVLVGDGWDDPSGEVEAARERAAAAGARVSHVKVEPDRASLEITA
jgi:outer membrane murein-binding lipoprotein Lpp